MEGIDNIATSITVKSHGNLTMKDSTGESEPTEWSHYLPRSYQELGYQESADTVGIRVSRRYHNCQNERRAGGINNLILLDKTRFTCSPRVQVGRVVYRTLPHKILPSPNRGRHYSVTNRSIRGVWVIGAQISRGTIPATYEEAGGRNRWRV